MVDWHQPGLQERAARSRSVFTKNRSPPHRTLLIPRPSHGDLGHLHSQGQTAAGRPAPRGVRDLSVARLGVQRRHGQGPRWLWQQVPVYALEERADGVCVQISPMAAREHDDLPGGPGVHVGQVSFIAHSRAGTPRKWSRLQALRGIGSVASQLEPETVT
jgi:hypothetical protein